MVTIILNKSMNKNMTILNARYCNNSLVDSKENCILNIMESFISAFEFLTHKFGQD